MSTPVRKSFQTPNEKGQGTRGSLPFFCRFTHRRLRTASLAAQTQALGQEVRLVQGERRQRRVVADHGPIGIAGRRLDGDLVRRRTTAVQ